MSQIAIKGATTGTGVFTLESPATNTDRTLVLPDEAGTVLTSATPVVAQKGVPAFSAYLGSGQSISADTPTKVEYNTEIFDATGAYDHTTYRFQPDVAGYYAVGGYLRLDAVSLTSRALAVYKNGSRYQNNTVYFASTAGRTEVHCNIYLNGSTDYVELYATATGYTATASNGSGQQTLFYGHLVSAA